jgi:hypothetical protein
VPALLKPLDVEPARVARGTRRTLDKQIKRIENLGAQLSKANLEDWGHC